MACIKCGRDAETGQVFCPRCLDVMEKYPVKPGTAVQLPKRKAPSPYRKPVKRKTVSPEEQIRVLRQRIGILVFCLLSALLIVALLAIPAYEHLFGNSLLPGQNYSIVTRPPPMETTAAVTPMN